MKFHKEIHRKLDVIYHNTIHTPSLAARRIDMSQLNFLIALIKLVFIAITSIITFEMTLFHSVQAVVLISYIIQTGKETPSKPSRHKPNPLLEISLLSFICISSLDIVNFSMISALFYFCFLMHCELDDLLFQFTAFMYCLVVLYSGRIEFLMLSVVQNAVHRGVLQAYHKDITRLRKENMKLLVYKDICNDMNIGIFSSSAQAESFANKAFNTITGSVNNSSNDWMSEFKYDRSLNESTLNPFSSRQLAEETLRGAIIQEETDYIKGSSKPRLINLGLYTKGSRIYQIFKTPYNGVSQAELSALARRAEPERSGLSDMEENLDRLIFDAKVNLTFNSYTNNNIFINSHTQKITRSRLSTKVLDSSQSPQKTKTRKSSSQQNLSYVDLSESSQVQRSFAPKASCTFCILDQTELIRQQQGIIDKVYKSLISAKLSHEVTSPSMGISSLIKCITSKLKSNLDKSALKELRQELLKVLTLNEQIQNVITLVGQYVNGLSKAKWQPERVEARVFAEYCYYMVLSGLTNNLLSEIKANVTFEEGLKTAVVNVDERLVKMALSEIVSNSLKFTHRGEIAIKVYQPIDIRKIGIMVKDTGVGFAKGKLEEVQRLYARLEANDRTDDSAPAILKTAGGVFFSRGGWDMGMEVVKTLCMKGDISVSIDSSIGNGTEVRLEMRKERQRVKRYPKSSMNLSENRSRTRRKSSKQLKTSGLKTKKLGNTKSPRASEQVSESKDIDSSISSEADLCKPKRAKLGLSEQTKRKKNRESTYFKLDDMDPQTLTTNWLKLGESKATFESLEHSCTANLDKKLLDLSINHILPDKQLSFEPSGNRSMYIRQNLSRSFNHSPTEMSKDSIISAQLIGQNSSKKSSLKVSVQDIEPAFDSKGLVPTQSLKESKQGSLCIEAATSPEVPIEDDLNEIEQKISLMKQQMKISFMEFDLPDKKESSSEESEQLRIPIKIDSTPDIKSFLVKSHTKVNPKPNFLHDSLVFSPSMMEESLKQVKSGFSQRASIKQNSHRSSDSEKLKILIVDDQAFCRKTLFNILHGALTEMNIADKFKIIEANDGIETLNIVIGDHRLGGNRIKLIISDQNMAFVNGTESFSLLDNLFCNGKINSNIPKVILTALGEEEAYRQIRKVCQVKSIIKKPANKQHMRDLIANYVICD